MRLGLKRLSGVVGVSQRFELAYPKAELEDLGLSGLQVVPTTIQPLQAQPVRRGNTTLAKPKKGAQTFSPRLLPAAIMPTIFT